MKKVLNALVVLTAVVCCTPSKKNVGETSAKQSAPPKYTYAKDIKPIIVSKCGPCHLEGKGKEEKYDDYLVCKANINEIIERISLLPTQKGFMPKKRTALGDSLVSVFKEWKNDGLR